jgi:hypothetical protein
MADVHQMTDLQSIPFKVSPEDKDGKRITKLPPGAVATVTSSDPGSSVSWSMRPRLPARWCLAR